MPISYKTSYFPRSQVAVKSQIDNQTPTRGNSSRYSSIGGRGDAQSSQTGTLSTIVFPTIQKPTFVGAQFNRVGSDASRLLKTFRPMCPRKDTEEERIAKLVKRAKSSRDWIKPQFAKDFVIAPDFVKTKDYLKAEVFTDPKTPIGVRYKPIMFQRHTRLPYHFVHPEEIKFDRVAALKRLRAFKPPNIKWTKKTSFPVHHRLPRNKAYCRVPGGVLLKGHFIPDEPLIEHHNGPMAESVLQVIYDYVTKSFPLIPAAAAQSLVSSLLAMGQTIYLLSQAETVAKRILHVGCLLIHLTACGASVKVLTDFGSVKRRIDKALSAGHIGSIRTGDPDIDGITIAVQNWLNENFENETQTETLSDDSIEGNDYDDYTKKTFRPLQDMIDSDASSLLSGSTGTSSISSATSRHTGSTILLHEEVCDSIDHHLTTLKWVQIGATLFYTALASIAAGAGKSVSSINAMFALTEHVKKASTNVKDLTETILKDVMGQDLDGTQGLYTIYTDLLTRAQAFDLKTATDVCSEGTTFVLRDLVRDIGAALNRQSIRFDNLGPSRTILTSTHTRLHTLLEAVWVRKRTSEHYVDPFVIQLVGEPGVGKTRFARYATDIINSEVYQKPDMGIYQVNVGKKEFFWLPYAGQKVAFMDEFLAQGPDDPLIGVFNEVFSGSFYNLEGAAIDDKVQPREFELAILSSNQGRRVLRDQHHHFAADSEAALYGRIRTFEIVDPLVAGNRRLLDHRRPDFSHLTIYPVTYQLQGAGYLKRQDGPAISVRQLIDIMKAGIQAARNNKVVPGAAIPPPGEVPGVAPFAGNPGPPINLHPGLARFNPAQAPPMNPFFDLVDHHAATPLIVHINGPPHTNKTLYASTILKTMAATYNLEYECIRSFNQNSSEAKMYVVDDMIRVGENGNSHEYMHWLSNVPYNAIVVVCSNIDIRFERESLLARTGKYFASFVRKTYDHNHLVVPNLGDVTGIARRLALSGSIKIGATSSRKSSSIVNPHCGVFVRSVNTGREFWTGLKFIPTNDSILTSTIEDAYITHLQSAGGRTHQHVMSIPETNADIIVTCPDIASLRNMLNNPARLISAYASPQPPSNGVPGCGVWVSRRCEQANLGGLNYWSYGGPLNDDNDLLSLTTDYCTRMSALGNNFTCIVHIGRFKAYVNGNMIKTTSNPLILRGVVDKGNEFDIILSKTGEPDIAVTIKESEVEYIVNGHWHLTSLISLPLSIKTIVRDTLINDNRLGNLRTNGMKAHYTRARKLWLLATGKKVKEFVCENKWALLIGGAAMLVLLIMWFKRNKAPLVKETNEFTVELNKKVFRPLSQEEFAYYQLNWMEDRQNLLGWGPRELFHLVSDLPSGIQPYWRKEYPFLSAHLPLELDEHMKFESHVLYMDSGEYESWLATIKSDDFALKRRGVVDKDLYDGIAEATRGRITRNMYLSAFLDPEEKKKWKSKTPARYSEDREERFKPKYNNRHAQDRDAREYEERQNKGNFSDMGHATEWRQDSTPNIATPKPIDDLVTRLQAARVGVFTDLGKVYGVHISNGYILTVFHVVSNIINTPTRPFITSDQYKGPADIVYSDSKRDIAILKAPHAHWPETIKRFPHELPNECNGMIVLNRSTAVAVYGPTFFFVECGLQYKDAMDVSPNRENLFKTVLTHSPIVTGPGDCGSPLVNADAGGTILGIYTGLNVVSKTAMSSAITQAELENIIKSVTFFKEENAKTEHHSLIETDRVVDEWTAAQLSCAKSDFPTFDLDVVARWKNSFFVPTKPGNWVESPLAQYLPKHKKPIVIDPVVLEKNGVILPVNNRGQRSVKMELARKFVRQRRAPKLDLLKNIAREAARHHFATSQVRKLTFDEAVYGLKPSDFFFDHYTPSPLDTSAGEYFKARWGVTTKSDMFVKNKDKTIDYTTGKPVVKNVEAYQDLKDRVEYIDKLARRGETLLVIHKACVKDELLKIEKADKAFGRLFYSCDWALNIWLNMTFGTVFASMRACHQDASWKIGINMETGFDEMIRGHLAKSSNVICADAANWDISMHPSTIKAAQEFISEVCYRSKSYDTTNLKNITKVAARYRSESFILVEDSVIKVDGIMTSGITGTSEVNSIMHLIMYLYAVNKHLNNVKLSVETFINHACFSSYGDDAKLSVAPFLEEILSDVNVKLMYDDFGVTATNDTKSGPPATTPIQNGSLCSRTPIWNDKHAVWLPGLKKVTIESMISWSRTGLPSDIAVRCRTASLYAAAWGADYYNFICDIIRKIPPEYKNSAAWRDAGPLEPHDVVISFLSQTMKGQTELTFKGFSEARRDFYQSLIADNSLVTNHTLTNNMSSPIEIDVVDVAPSAPYLIVEPPSEKPSPISESLPSYEQAVHEQVMNDHCDECPRCLAGVYCVNRAANPLRERVVLDSYKSYLLTLKDLRACQDRIYSNYVNQKRMRNQLPSFRIYELDRLIFSLDYHILDMQEIIDSVQSDSDLTDNSIDHHMEAPPPVAPSAASSSISRTTAVSENAPLDQQLVAPLEMPSGGAIPFNDAGTVMVLQNAQIPSMQAATGNAMDVKIACQEFYDFATEPYLITEDVPVGTVVACINYGIGACSPRAQAWINQHRSWDGVILIKAMLVSNSLNQGQLMLGLVDTRDSHDLVNGVLIPKKTIKLDTLQIKEPVIVDMNKNYTQQFALMDMRRQYMWRDVEDNDADFYRSNQSLVAIVYTKVSANAKDSGLSIPLRFQSAWMGTAMNPKPLDSSSDATVAGLEQTRFADIVPSDEFTILVSDGVSPPVAGDSFSNNKVNTFPCNFPTNNENSANPIEMFSFRQCTDGINEYMSGEGVRVGKSLYPTDENPANWKFFFLGTPTNMNVYKHIFTEQTKESVKIYDPATDTQTFPAAGDTIRVIKCFSDKGIHRAVYLKIKSTAAVSGTRNITIDDSFLNTDLETVRNYANFVAGARPPTGFCALRFANSPNFQITDINPNAYTIGLTSAEISLRKLFNRIGFNVSFKIMDPDGYEIQTVCFINGGFFTTSKIGRYHPVDVRSCRISNVTRLGANVRPISDDLPENRVLGNFANAEINTMRKDMEKLQKMVEALTLQSSSTDVSSPIELVSMDELRASLNKQAGAVEHHMLAVGAGLTAAGMQSERWGHRVFDRRTMQQMSAQNFDQMMKLQVSNQEFRTNYSKMMTEIELEARKNFFDYRNAYDAASSAQSMSNAQNTNATTQTYGASQPTEMTPSKYYSYPTETQSTSSGSQYNVNDTKTYSSSGQQTYGASAPVSMMPSKYARGSYNPPPKTKSIASGSTDTRGYSYSTAYPSQDRVSYTQPTSATGPTKSYASVAASTTSGRPTKPAAH
ncbi:hypothetical protein [Shahe isopoda virus 1]|uniref:hypothetical protein n=1 Tax=Shahe isopoda virus 1 TaxID=1923421 RepID=UPI00090A93C2|nr:hypothetical protein [Shahe isopoda virus 1]APG77363.1 hypothetical protein [Shahe isopoda virus 1]